jgi:hypothetical protein
MPLFASSFYNLKEVDRTLLFDGKEDATSVQFVMNHYQTIGMRGRHP